MKKSRSASKKRPSKKKPTKSRSASAKRKVTKKTKKTTTRSAAAKRRTGAKAKTRVGAKKTRARKATKKITRKKTAPTARKRAVSTTKKPLRAASPRKPKALKPVVPTGPVVPANEFKAGVVTHYYSHLSVAVIAVTDRGLRLGDRIHVKGHTSDFYQAVGSMQVEHDTISAATAGQTVGLKVTEHAREHDTVYLVT